MKQQEKVRCTADRFINYERKYTIYLIRKGLCYEQMSIYARSLYQAVAHSVCLIAYAFAKLGVVDVIILPEKASKSGLSVFRQKKGEDGLIRRIPQIINNDFTFMDIIVGWNYFKSSDRFIG